MESTSQIESLLPVPDWRWRRFEALTVFELDAIHRVRQEVFVIEQQCIFQDADGCDQHSYHLGAWMPGAALPCAYARIVAPGIKYAEPSIGRVLTALSARGTGLGRELVERAIAGCRDAFPGRGIRISAQARLEGFYAGVGFEGAGRPYIEDGIPHHEMLLGGRSTQGEQASVLAPGSSQSRVRSPTRS